MSVSDNSPKAANRDWIYALADQPARKVTGGRLGYAYSKRSLENGFENRATYHPDAASSRAILRAAKDAVVLNDLAELDRMARALETCARYGAGSVAELDVRIGAVEARAGGGDGSSAEAASLEALRDAREFVADNGLLPRESAPRRAKPAAKRQGGKAAKDKAAEARRNAARGRQRDRRERGER